MVRVTAMQPRRTNLLLLLLVLTPLALLAWLGTYLIRDAARSTDSAMQAVLAERLAAADHQLVDDLRHLAEQLGQLAASAAPDASAAALGTHPWVVEAWASHAGGETRVALDKGTHTPSPGDDAASRSISLRQALAGYGPVDAADENQPFLDIQSTEPDRSRQTVWMTFVKNSGYDIKGTRKHAAAPPSGLSGWHVTDGDFIYWLLDADKSLVCARLDSRQMREALYQRLPPPGLPEYPGRMELRTITGIALHTSGRQLWGSGGAPAAERKCSPPLSQWVLAYSPAEKEFPQPYLFPILLGVSSGCLLVMALAWTFSRENERELRLAQQRVSFVNQISHELKTPLTNIQLYTEMAANRVEEAGDAIARRQLRVVEAETSRLDRLIQNVMNYARQQRDRLSVIPREIVLDEVVGRAVGNWRLLLENKGLKISAGFGGPASMSADPDAIEQILGNLLSNVDKYASHGKWVSIRTETAEGCARVIVEDRGPGIPAGKRRQIFEPFERLRSDLNEGVSGTGIGLTISRELADLHGGTLEVCPQYKEGARFILTLPIKKP
ncbi:MAG TPA: hypothetical protein DIT13_19590 [Verrucomicrobiales bacterium]|nr:hypothetical protein [Verrucomicrobiales bacterium]